MARPNALEEVTEAIDERRSFLVEAGAGSGKTYALVHGLHHILRTQRHDLEQAAKQVACITYTNVAKQEILQRIAEDPLVFVGTIHEFLWEVIRGYQQEIKAEILVHNDELKKPTEDLQNLLPALEISYSDRGRNYAKGRISHDEVIELSRRLFQQYPKIARLTADRFPILFI